MGMDVGGYIPDTNGMFGSILFYDATKTFVPLCGIMWYGGMGDGTGKYEDYTSIYGTVNVFDDRNDGLITDEIISGFAGVGRIYFKKQEFMFHYGLASNKISYYQALYDPLEILGNNGYYYIDSNKSNEKESGLFYGIKYNYYLPNMWKDFFIGVGFQGNTLSDVPNVLVKIDFGFVLGQ